MTPAEKARREAGLRELADRVEALSGPCRETDALIAVALNLGVRGVTEDDHEYLSAIRKDDYCAAGTYWFHCRSGKSLRTAEPYTASIDAAMTVVPLEWSLDCLKEGEVGRWYVNLRPRDWVSDWRYGKAAAPALTLTAAALRAVPVQERVL